MAVFGSAAVRMRHMSVALRKQIRARSHGQWEYWYGFRQWHVLAETWKVESGGLYDVIFPAKLSGSSRGIRHASLSPLQLISASTVTRSVSEGTEVDSIADPSGYMDNRNKLGYCSQISEFSTDE